MKTFRSAGVLKKLEPIAIGASTKTFSEDDTMEPVEFDSLNILFITVASVYLLSLLIFVLEIIWFSLRKRRKIQNIHSACHDSDETNGDDKEGYRYMYRLARFQRRYGGVTVPKNEINSDDTMTLGDPEAKFNIKFQFDLRPKSDIGNHNLDVSRMAENRVGEESVRICRGSTA